MSDSDLPSSDGTAPGATAPDRSAPDLLAIQRAGRRIAPYVHRTPVMRSQTLEAELGASIHFKCENFQKVGAFKARGAVNTALQLTEDQAARGLITHSSGNHAAAIAYAARIRGVPATIIMPRDAPPVKVAAVRGYGAEIVFCGRSDRERVCEQERLQRGATFVHPYAHPHVIEGQGTAALELIDEVGALDLVVTPVGGGGLLSGSAIASRGLLPGVEVWGAEPFAVDDAYRSMRSGHLQPAVSDPQTVCDGLLTGLGEINFRVLQAQQVEIVRVEEAAILAAARFVLERMKIVIEPSCATVIAALRAQSERVRGKTVGVILSGGNTDFAWLT